MGMPKPLKLCLLLLLLYGLFILAMKWSIKTGIEEGFAPLHESVSELADGVREMERGFERVEKKLDTIEAKQSQDAP